jgi:hypothetical protein
MGILNNPKSQDKDTAASARRRSTQTDFSKLGPLKPGGAVGFVGFRDVDQNAPTARRKSKKGSESDMESDDDDEDDPIIGKVEVEESKDGNLLMSPDDLRQQGELAEGVRKIKVRKYTTYPPLSYIPTLILTNRHQLKRQHSSEPLASGNSDNGRPSKSNTPSASTPPATTNQADTPPLVPGSGLPEPATIDATNNPSIFVGSPLKKQRASLSNADDENLRVRMGSNISSRISEVLGSGEGSPSGSEGANFREFGGSIGGGNGGLGGSLASEPKQIQQDGDTEL